MTPPRSAAVAAAYDYCQAVARREARNFYYAFLTLPAPKRRAIYAVYAYARLADDIADGFVYLASDDARWITGTSLVIDGGLTIGLPE